MGDGSLELTIIAAEGLKNVNVLGKMSPYAVAWIDPQLKKFTKTLNNSGRDPTWNDTLILLLQAQLLSNPNAALVIQVLSAGPLKTKIIGTTTLMLHEIKRICSIKDRNEEEIFTLQLWRPSGRAYGVLKVSLKLKGSAMFGTDDNVPPYQQNWAATNPSPYDVPVQGIPVTALYSHLAPPPPPAVSPDIVEHSTSDEQCTYSGTAPPAYMPLPPTAPPIKQSNAPKNFFIGLLSGAVAAVLVGSAVM